jgi:hypothetical protein
MRRVATNCMPSDDFQGDAIAERIRLLRLASLGLSYNPNGTYAIVHTLCQILSDTTPIGDTGTYTQAQM